MSAKTVIYRPAKLRYARNGAIFGILMLLLHYATGQASELVYQGPMAPWLFHVTVAAFVIFVFATIGYAIGSLKDRNNPGPTERVVWRPKRRRWAAYGAIAGFLLAAVEYVHLLGSDKLEPWTATFTLHDGVSAVVTVGVCSLVCFVAGTVRDASTS